MSMSEIKLIKPTDELIRLIALDMRKEDRIEVKASSGFPPYSALKYSWDKSDFCTVVTACDIPIAVLGLSVINRLTGLGTPWLLSSEDALKYKRAFLELSPPVVEDMLEICPKLINYVHIDNKISIRWLKWLGFTVEPNAVEYGVNGELFYKFYMTRG